MERRRSIQPVVFAVLSVLLASCASTGNRGESAQSRAAHIEVIDKPDGTFRYVRWKREDYDPTSFMGAVRGKYDRLILDKPSDVAVRCLAALSADLSIPASVTDPSGGTVAVAAGAETTEEACTIHYEIPHPTLATGQYYVSRSRDGVAFEGDDPVDPTMFALNIRGRDASALVVRRPRIGDLLCFGAIADIAHVLLYEVKRDGTLSEIRVGGQSVKRACGL